MPSALSLQKPRPGIGMVVLVDGEMVVPLGLGVVVVAGLAVVTTGLLVVGVLGAVVVTPGFLVVVDGSGGNSVRGGRNRKIGMVIAFIKDTTLVHKNLPRTLPTITSLFLSYLDKPRT